MQPILSKFTQIILIHQTFPPISLNNHQSRTCAAWWACEELALAWWAPLNINAVRIINNQSSIIKPRSPTKSACGPPSVTIRVICGYIFFFFNLRLIPETCFSLMNTSFNWQCVNNFAFSHKVRLRTSVPLRVFHMNSKGCVLLFGFTSVPDSSSPPAVSLRQIFRLSNLSFRNNFYHSVTNALGPITKYS